MIDSSRQKNRFGKREVLKRKLVCPAVRRHSLQGDPTSQESQLIQPRQGTLSHLANWRDYSLPRFSRPNEKGLQPIGASL
jgi:hypothetical protein